MLFCSTVKGSDKPHPSDMVCSGSLCRPCSLCPPCVGDGAWVTQHSHLALEYWATWPKPCSIRVINIFLQKILTLSLDRNGRWYKCSLGYLRWLSPVFDMSFLILNKTRVPKGSNQASPGRQYISKGLKKRKGGSLLQAQGTASTKLPNHPWVQHVLGMGKSSVGVERGGWKAEEEEPRAERQGKAS